MVVLFTDAEKRKIEETRVRGIDLHKPNSKGKPLVVDYSGLGCDRKGP